MMPSLYIRKDNPLNWKPCQRLQKRSRNAAISKDGRSVLLTACTSFKWSPAQVYFFQWFIWNMLCLCHYGSALLRVWFQTDLGRKNSATFLKIKAGKTFLTMVTRWSRSTSNFCTLISQNLTGEFMWKIYAASWKLFTLTAKADRVLCQLVMSLTVFVHLMYKMKYSCYQESSVIHGWFVYWPWFLVEKCVACQNWVIRFRMASFSSFTLLNQCVRGFKSLKQLWPSVISFRNWISNGKPE